MINNASSSIDYSQTGVVECVQDTNQLLQMPIDHNGPAATQCHGGGFGLCDLARHDQDTLSDRP